MTAWHDAVALLRTWLPANDDPDRPQIQVATVDADGRPDIRTVLLTSWDERGFAFHTDSASRKAAQLAAHPAVAIEVLWPGFSRQLVVRGVAEAQPQDEQDGAYAARSPYLRQLAWVNTIELAQRERDARTEAWRAFAASRPPETLAPPPTWSGYLVRPDRLTFWQSDADGPSHRTEFRADSDGTWTVHALAG